MAIVTQRTPLSLALPKIMSADPGQVKHRPRGGPARRPTGGVRASPPLSTAGLSGVSDVQKYAGHHGTTPG